MSASVAPPNLLRVVGSCNGREESVVLACAASFGIQMSKSGSFPSTVEAVGGNLEAEQGLPKEVGDEACPRVQGLIGDIVAPWRAPFLLEDERREPASAGAGAGREGRGPVVEVVV